MEVVVSGKNKHQSVNCAYEENSHRADGCVSGSPIGPSDAPAARVDRWLECVSGQYPSSFPREGQAEPRSRASVSADLAAAAHWHRDQTNPEKAGGRNHPQDGSWGDVPGGKPASALPW